MEKMAGYAPEIYWRSKINQLSWVTRGFLASCLFSLSSPLCASLIALRGSSLRKPLAPRVAERIKGGHFVLFYHDPVLAITM